MSEDTIKYGKDGKPTKASMEWAFKNDKKLFNELQNKHFTTRGTMGDNSILKWVKDKLKSDKSKDKK